MLLAQKFKGITDTAVNIAIIATSVTFAFLVYRNLNEEKLRGQPQPASFIKAGDLVPIAGAPRNTAYVLLVMQTTCQYCERSIPFYKQLYAHLNSKHTKLYFTFPEGLDQSQGYLRKNSLPTDNVLQSSPSSLHIQGTPTLILVNHDGRARSVWVGELSDKAEKEVEASLE